MKHILHRGTLVASSWFGHSKTVQWSQQSREKEPMVPTQWATMNESYAQKLLTFTLYATDKTAAENTLGKGWNRAANSPVWEIGENSTILQMIL